MKKISTATTEQNPEQFSFAERIIKRCYFESNSIRKDTKSSGPDVIIFRNAAIQPISEFVIAENNKFKAAQKKRGFFSPWFSKPEPPQELNLDNLMRAKVVLIKEPCIGMPDVQLIKYGTSLQLVVEKSKAVGHSTQMSQLTLKLIDTTLPDTIKEFNVEGI